MTQGGGTGGNGIVFSVGTDSTGFTVIHRFTGGPGDGSAPLGSLVLSGSILYGMTSSGGNVQNNGLYKYGTIFKVNLDGSGYTILHNFAGYPTDGQGPQYGGLALSGNTVYGTTVFGGTGGAGTVSAGTVFKVNTDGSGYAVLHTFSGGPADGASPLGQLIVSGSYLYGFTTNGGSSGRGVLFRMDLDGGNFTLMHSFDSFPGDGDLPVGEPTISGSRLYGTTGRGGQNSLGTILGMGTDGSNYDVLYSFSGADRRRRTGRAAPAIGFRVFRNDRVRWPVQQWDHLQLHAHTRAVVALAHRTRSRARINLASPPATQKLLQLRPPPGRASRSLTWAIRPTR